MKTGDTFLSACASPDGQPRPWTVCESLGQGIWGQSFLVRDGDGNERVLKVPLRLEDFPAEAAVPPDIGELCIAAAEEQAMLLIAGKLPFLPRLEARLTLNDGRPALLMPRYSATLARRLEAGMPLVTALQLVQRISALLAKSGQVHGNLRPTNILLTERGEPVLSDLLTPAAESALTELECLAPQRATWRPPEARGAARGVWDTWAMCQMLWQAAMTREAGPQRLEVPDDGLDKLTLATLKDRAMARLAGERTNPRFRARLTERLGATLNRGLSRESEPSPPFRFVEATDLLPRLREITALIAPEVEDVGPVLLGPQADSSGTFQGGEGIRFAVSVGLSSGVSDHEDVVCGLRLVDIDRPHQARVPLDDARFAVSSHPSGRLRFQFDIPLVPPGRYRVRAAFSVKDSGQEPEVASGKFEVRPPPGYVPPAAPEAPATAIHFRPRAQEPEAEPEAAEDEALEAPQVAARAPRIALSPGLTPTEGPSTSAPTQPHEADAPTASGWSTSPDDISDPGAEIIEGLFPRPLAPPEEDPDDLMEAPSPRQAAAPTPVAVELEETEATYASAGGHGRTLHHSGAVHTAPPIEARHGAYPAAPPASALPFPGGQVRPSLAVPRPSLSRGSAGPRLPMASAPPPPGAPGPVAEALLSEDEEESEEWDFNPEEWAAFSGESHDLGIEHDALPLAEGEDLPSPSTHRLRFDASRIPGFNWMIELVQRDTYTAFVAAVAASFVLLLACMALLRAC